MECRWICVQVIPYKEAGNAFIRHFQALRKAVACTKRWSSPSYIDTDNPKILAICIQTCAHSTPLRPWLLTALPTVLYYSLESHLGLLRPYIGFFGLKHCLGHKLQVIIYIHHSLCFAKHEMVLTWCLDFPFPSLSAHWCH